MSAGLDDIRRQLADLTVRVERAEGLRAMMDRDQADLKQRLDARNHLSPIVIQCNHGCGTERPAFIPAVGFHG